MIPNEVRIALDDEVRDRLNAVGRVMGWTDHEVLNVALVFLCEFVENQAKGWRYGATLPGEVVHRPIWLKRPEIGPNNPPAEVDVNVGVK